MGRAAFYDPDQVSIYFAGILIQGYAEGEFISVEPMSPAFEEVVGTDGEVARSKVSDRRVKVIIKLLQTSLSNALLSAALKSDRNAANGKGVGTFAMQDNSGTSIVTGKQAWIVAHPAAAFDRTAKSREWEIHIADGDNTVGGN